MRTAHAQQVTEQLASWSIRATLLPRDADHVEVRIAIAEGLEALWSVDAEAGLRADVVRDGILVSSLPALPGSRGLPPAAQAWLIATADYGLDRSVEWRTAPLRGGCGRPTPSQRPARSVRWLRRRLKVVR
jgi:hypothetical protein